MIGGSQQSFVSADCAETLFLQPRELMSTQSAVLQGLRISGITASITSPKGPNSSFTQSVNYVKQPQTRWISPERLLNVVLTVWCFQGEKGLQGRAGPPGPVGIGEPGQPVSVDLTLPNTVRVSVNINSTVCNVVKAQTAPPGVGTLHCKAQKQNVSRV